MYRVMIIVVFSCVVALSPALAQERNLTPITSSNVGQIAEIQVIEAHAKSVWAVQYDRANQLILSSAPNDTIRYWDLNGTQVATLSLREYEEISTFALSSDGVLLVYGVWDTTTGRPLPRVYLQVNGESERTLLFEGGNTAIYNIAFSPDDSVVATSGWQGGEVRMWDIIEEEELPPIKSLDPIYEIGFISDNLLATSDTRFLVEVWDLESRTIAMAFASPHFAAGPRGWFVVSDVDETLVRVINTDPPYSLLYEMPIDGALGTYSPTDSMLATRKPGEGIKIWGTFDGLLLKTLSNRECSSSSFMFSPDHLLFIVGCGDGTIRLWGIEE